MAAGKQNSGEGLDGLLSEDSTVRITAEFLKDRYMVGFHKQFIYIVRFDHDKLYPVGKKQVRKISCP